MNLCGIVKELLAQGSRVNESGKQGISALYMAVHQKNFETASLLLEAGGDEAENYEELTGKYDHPWTVSPLSFAGLKGYSREWINLLLKDKRKIGKPGWMLEVAMEDAARLGKVECLTALIDNGADLDKGSGNERSYGCPLQAACERSKNGIVRLLLERGANPNVTGGECWLGELQTPLQLAAWERSVESVMLLLEFGADPNIEGGIFGNPVIASIWNIHKAP